MPAVPPLPHAARRIINGDADRGSVLVAAVAVAFIAITLGLLVVSQSIITVGDSGRDRQRTGQVHAAESGVDSAFYQLQLGVTPCSVSTANVGSRPDTTAVATTVAYYDAANGLITCTAGVLTATPVKAVISAVSTSTNRVTANGAPSSRTMEAEVLLSPSSGGKGYAIFSGAPFTVPNSFQLTGNGVDSPDVYVGGAFTCNNSSTLGGSVFSASGNVQLGNSCLISGGLNAYGSIAMSNSARVARNVSSSRLGLTMANTSSIGGDARLRGTFSGTRSAITGGLVTGDTTIPDPLSQPLPWVGYDPPDWVGYSIQDRGTDCSSVKTDMFTVTTPTVFYADCVLDFSNNNSGLTLKTDVALFLPQGMTVTNNFGLASSSATIHNLWIISPPKHRTAAMPAGWTASDCDAGNISLGNQTNIATSVRVFLYSCKTIQADNSSTFSGQIYGQTVNVANSFTMAFVSLPPQGVDLGGAPALPGFRVEVLYKRET